MTRVFLCLLTVGLSLVPFAGCGSAGPGDEDQSRSSETHGGLKEASIRGDKAASNTQAVAIAPKPRDSTAGAAQGINGDGNAQTAFAGPTGNSPQTSNDSSDSGFSIFDGDLAHGFHAIAGEIADLLKLKKTLVVWIIDKTPGSVGIRGNAVRGVFSVADEAIKKSQSRGGAKNPLSIAIVAFGKEVTTVTAEPTVDASQAATLASGVGEDATDNPVTFAAVSKAAELYLLYRNKGYEVIFVIAADENGRDWEQLDEVIPKLNRVAVSVYGIGAAVPFGRPAGEPADKTPSESFALERIDLAYPGRQAEIDLTDSGYGPFGLERLCRKTQGRFFRLRPSSASPGWKRGSDETVDPELLKAHAPDYVSAKQYQQLLGENKARMALVNAARMPHVDAMTAVRQTMFVPQSDAAKLAVIIGNAQRGAADKSLDVDRLYNVLAAGEADRPKLTGARWQAEFDLAMGRVLAAKSRIDGYNSILATIKQGKAFSKPGSKAWVLERADGVSGDSALNKRATNARMYLNRVIKEHPGTPWAALAERELTENVGWELTEE
ncbi:MAG TPA: hypothetical protein VG056_16200 [Pirellulales bacterium]|nr:hypothetical protein [Pirellulales bacterium]